MEIVDFGTAVISGILLYRLCHINILKEYFSTIKRYWVTLAFSGGYNIISVNLQNDFIILFSLRNILNRTSIIFAFWLHIACFLQWYTVLQVSCGNDYGMEFAWIKNEEKRARMLEKTVKLSNYTLSN